MPKEQLGLSLLCVAQQLWISSEQRWGSHCLPSVGWADVLPQSLYFTGDQWKILLHEPSSQQLKLSLLSLLSSCRQLPRNRAGLGFPHQSWYFRTSSLGRSLKWCCLS